jgi:glutathione S-transferase
MSGNRIILWGVGTSRAFRVHWALCEMGLSYDTVPIQARTGETKTEEYAQLNPKQKIPYFRDGELGISESAAVLQYLFATYGDAAGLYAPPDARAQALSDEWCYTVMTEFDAHSLYLIRRHKYLSEIYGTAPDAVASAEEYFLKQLAAMTARIGAADPYLFGDRLGAADILLTTCLDWAVAYDITVNETCLAYRSRGNARPAYKAAQQANAVP